MTPSPAARRLPSPRWFDVRLLAGIGLVLVSVVAGARIVASADHRVRYVAFVRDLAAGTVLTADELTYASVRFSDSSAATYLRDATAATGRVLNRSVAHGELVARTALDVPASGVTVVVPLAPDAAPKLAAGQRVAVWLATAACPSVTLLPVATVQSARPSAGGAFDAPGGQSIVVSLSPDLASRVVTALSMDGARLRAGVLTGPVETLADLPDLDRCRTHTP